MIPGIVAGRPVAPSPTTYRTHLLFGGADGSTTFIDETGKSWTAFGNAQIDTSLGDQRGLFDGSGDYITTPDHNDLDLPGDFLIRFTMRFASMSGYQTILAKGHSPRVNGGWALQTGNGDGRLIFYRFTTTNTVAIATESSGTISAGQDYLIEVARSGTTISIKRNGVTVASGTNNTDFSNTAALAIGGGSTTGFNNYWFNGWMKDFSIQ